MNQDNGVKERAAAALVSALQARVAAFVAEHGRDRVIALTAGFVAAIGALLPFARGTDQMAAMEAWRQGGASGTWSLLQTGLVGRLLVALPLALGLLPVLAKNVASRWCTSLYGVACATLGMFLAPAVFASAARFGVPHAGLSIGWATTLLGYAGLTYGYLRIMKGAQQ